MKSREKRAERVLRHDQRGYRLHKVVFAEGKSGQSFYASFVCQKSRSKVVGSLRNTPSSLVLETRQIGRPSRSDRSRLTLERESGRTWCIVLRDSQQEVGSIAHPRWEMSGEANRAGCGSEIPSVHPLSRTTRPTLHLCHRYRITIHTPDQQMTQEENKRPEKLIADY